MEENKEALPEMWLNALESIIHGIWYSKVWDMQAFNKLVKGCVWLPNFKLKIFFYILH